VTPTLRLDLTLTVADVATCDSACMYVMLVVTASHTQCEVMVQRGGASLHCDVWSCDLRRDGYYVMVVVRRSSDN